MSTRAGSPTAKDIFLEALDESGPGRDALVERRCGGDAALASRVRALLAAHDSAGGFMGGVTSAGLAPRVVGATADPVQGSPAMLSRAPAEKPGAKIGPYTLIKVLGEGGFGTVYLADQSEPVSRKVALKILKLGMDSQQVIARFEIERQALALMDHPSIAKVLDAGTTERGRPYFVMDLVRGEPIDEFCNRRELTVRQRLELFEQVSLAVQHAHQKGIIHRDLKPSNVLVTVVDGRPLPKIIDFGIAKATESSLSERSALTDHAQLVGTPEYMSPEQANLMPADVDTRSDVYTLGVILYELLTGAPPFERDRIRKAGFTELQRIIREDVPPKPSTRLAVREASREGVDAAGPVSRLVRSKSLAGELDWIVMKCLEKDRRMRYQTAFALASDLRRYLDGEPVEASPPSRTYRLRKYVAKHRPQVVTGATIAVALIVMGVGGTIFGLRAMRAERSARLQTLDAKLQSEKYRAVAEFTEKLLSAIEPSVAQGADTSLLRSVLDDAVVELDRTLAESPQVSAPVRSRIAVTYMRIGELEKALDQAEQAHREARRAYGPDHKETLDAMNTLGVLYLENGDPEGARQVLERCVEVSVREFGDEADGTLQARGNLANAYGELGNIEQAMGMMMKVREARLRIDARADLDAATRRKNRDSLLTISNNLATAYRGTGDHAMAIPLFEQVLAAQEADPDQRDRAAMTMGSLGSSYLEVGRTGEGVALLGRSLALKREILPEGHPSLIVALNGMGDASVAAGDDAAAEGYYLEAHALAQAHLGERDQRRLIVRNNLGSFYRKTGRPELALEHLQAAAADAAGILGEKDPGTMILRANLVAVYVLLDRFADGAAVGAEIAPTAREVFEADDARLASVLVPCGQALVGLDRFAEAEPLLVDAVRCLEAAKHVPPDQLRTAVHSAADLYERWGREADAKPYRDRLAALAAPPGPE